jgi:hypothetical protein
VQGIGQLEQDMVRQSLRAGRPIPTAVLNAPELILGLELYLRAFFELDSCRNHSMGPASIPWTSIAEYADIHDFDEEQRDDLIYFIRRLDNDHLTRIQEDLKRRPK